MNFWTLGWDPSQHYHALVLINERKEVINTITTDGLDEAITYTKKFTQQAKKAGFVLQYGVEANPYPVLDTLFASEFHPLYSLNAQKVNSYKKTHELSGNKEDIADAISCAYFLMDFKHKLTAYVPKSSLEKEALLISKELNFLRDEETKTWERFWATIAQSAPALIKVLDNPNANWFLDLMNQLPWRMKHTSFTAFIKGCRKRGALLHDERLRPLYTELRSRGNFLDKQIIQSRISQLKQIRSETKIWEKRAGNVLEKWDSAVYLMSIRGMGVKTLVRLLAYFGKNLGDMDVSNLSGYSGVAPIFNETGKGPKNIKRVRRHRIACNKNLKTTLCLFSNYSMGHNEWALNAYKRFRDTGQTHWEALRNLSIRWLRIMLALINTKTFYNAEIHEKNILRNQRVFE